MINNPPYLIITYSSIYCWRCFGMVCWTTTKNQRI